MLFHSNFLDCLLDSFLPKKSISINVLQESIKHEISASAKHFRIKFSTFATCYRPCHLARAIARARATHVQIKWRLRLITLANKRPLTFSSNFKFQLCHLEKYWPLHCLLTSDLSMLATIITCV